MNALLPVVIDDPARLTTLVDNPISTRQLWAGRAACRDLAGEAYFPDDGDLPSLDALAVCAGCPVAAECLATALVHEANDGFRNGWWGGYAPDERAVIADALGIVDAPDVEPDLSTPSAIARHLRGAGRTVRAIADELGCTKRTVYRYLADAAA